MRAVFIPQSDKQWEAFFRLQMGNGMGYEAALPFQRGSGLGSIFKGLFRTLLPMVAKVGKSVGKEALKTGMEIGGDYLAGEDIKTTAKRRTKAAGSRLLRKGAKKLSGGALGARPKGNTIKATKQKTKKTKKRDQLGTYYVA